MYSIMKAILAFNFNRSTMKNKSSIAVDAGSKPVLGGPNSAFTPYKVNNNIDEVAVNEFRNKRKNAFRQLKIMFGMSEPVGIESTSASQK